MAREIKFYQFTATYSVDPMTDAPVWRYNETSQVGDFGPDGQANISPQHRTFIPPARIQTDVQALFDARKTARSAT